MATTTKNMTFDVNLLPSTTEDHNLGSSSLKWNLFVNEINGSSYTTYSSLAAASGGTAVSLVTTGEKYTWNSKASGSHIHGNITNAGAITSTEAIANGDALVIVNSSDSSKLIGTTITFDGSTTTKALTQKGTWETFNNYSHPTGDGNLHIPANGTTNNGKYLQATGTAGTYQWASLPSASTTVAGITTVGASGGAAAYSHGNHVPTVETANNAKFLRNDNTWQTVTPANIGAAASSHTHNYAGSSSAGGTANDANELKGKSETSGAITTAANTGCIRYSYNVNNGTTGLFSTNNNANGILNINRYSGNYNSQLGFSDNGKIYYRNLDTALDTTTSWEQIAFISDISTNDTKNTAGTTNSTSKLYLAGATSQAANPQTYSYQYTYVNNGLLSSTQLGLNASGTEKAHMEWNATDSSIDFVFN